MGIAFTNAIAPQRYLTNQIPLNGSGVALGDVDGDGIPDVFLGGLAGRSALFRNLGGWKFEDVTASSGLAFGTIDVTGASFADIDGDGHLDLVVNTLGAGTWIFANDGHGHFAKRAVLNPGRAGMSVAIADVDGDGLLDLYVANYRGVTVRDEPGARYTLKDDGGTPYVAAYNGRSTTNLDLVGRFTAGMSGVRENGEPGALYLNQGDWKFRAVDWADGTFRDEEDHPLPGPLFEWGLSVMIRDFTGDGLPDIYVCNDFESPDRFWVNTTAPGGPLRFRAISLLALRNTSAFSMGVDAADIDRDGVMDFLVLDMLSRDHASRNVQIAGLPPSHSQPGVFEDRPQFSHNTLFRGRGDGTFAEIGRHARLSASEWSWTPVFLDVDLDGYEDLLVSNGHEMDMMDVDASDAAEVRKAARRMSPREQLGMRRMFRRLATPNAAFRNRGDLTFDDVSRDWHFDAREVGIGMAAADLDGDGDLDLVVNNLNAAPTLYRNDATAARLPVRLRGRGANTRGIGARLRVTGGPVVQGQEMIAGGRYLSGDDAMRVFAAGNAVAMTVEVEWRSGRRSVVTNVVPGKVLVVTEPDGPVPARTPPTAAGPTWFEDVSERASYTPAAPPFDDFARQPLLPRSLATEGPGVTWVDLDGDGRDDLVVGTGAGGLPGAFANDGNGGFRRLVDAPFQKPVGRDMTTILPFGHALLAGSSNYKDGTTNGGCLRVLDLARKASGEAVLGQGITTGPLAEVDPDGAGALHVFVGGRAVPGGWPAPTDSLLLKPTNGKLAPYQRLPKLGMASDAVFADLDGDGRAELVVACEWGPVRVFRLEGVQWVDATDRLGLASGTGRWNSVAAGDFDGDGRLDLVVGNWGSNDFHGSLPGALPLRCHYGDFDGNGTIDVVESYVGPGGVELPVRKFGSVLAALPYAREKFATYAKYGAASLSEIHGTALGTNPVVEASSMATTVFLNRGGRFEARALPAEAQFSPVFGIAVADFDGDGNEDVFLGQNFFAVHPEDARQDAGRGVMLAGDGRGGFRAVPAMESGVMVHGEARGAAVADFDGDGRVDLAVAQHGAPLRLFRNATARPGIRVRLDGPPGNPRAVGAVVRLEFAGTTGPARSVGQGGGYWSCNSPTQVMGTGERVATGVWVRWPGGHETRTPLAAGAKGISIDPNGVGKPLP